MKRLISLVFLFCFNHAYSTTITQEQAQELFPQYQESFLCQSEKHREPKINEYMANVEFFSPTENIAHRLANNAVAYFYMKQKGLTEYHTSNSRKDYTINRKCLEVGIQENKEVFKIYVFFSINNH